MSADSVTLVAAIICSVLGVGAFVHIFLMVNTWPRASGRVVGNDAQASHSDASRSYAFFPRIAFQAADGKRYEVTGDIGLADEWPLGKTVKLRYCASDPRKATIMAGWQRLLFAGVFMGFAVASWGAWFGVLR